MIEARLHTDRVGRPHHEEIVALQAKLTGVKTLPVYLLMEPKSEKVLSRRSGATATVGAFLDFLKSADESN